MKRKQTEMILDYMREHGSITPMQAILELNCTRLAARISDLKKEGYAIRSVMDTSISTDGVKKHFTRYSLAE